MSDPQPPTAWSPPQAPAWGAPALPRHPRSSPALVLGILSVCSLVVGVTAVLGPLAWYYGATSMRDIDREPRRWSGRSEAKAGMIMGIAGTAVLAFAIVLIVVVVSGIALVNGVDTGYGS